MRRRLILAIAAVMTATLALVLSLVMGMADPSRSFRVYLACVGLVVCGVAVSWMKAPGAKQDSAHWKPPGSSSRSDATPGDARPGAAWHPALAEIHALAGRIRLSRVTMPDYYRLVRPRLADLASSKLARLGIGIEDAPRAEAVLGRAYRLVDPKLARSGNRDAHGVELAEIDELVEALERL
ncbi:MAG: hypothetical protein ACRD0Z_13050 [Acidimicrobiales bacterium]